MPGGTARTASYISILLNVPYDADPRGCARAGGDSYHHGLGVRYLHHCPGAGHDPAHHEVRVAYSTQADTVMLYPADNMMTLLPAAALR